MACVSPNARKKRETLIAKAFARARAYGRAARHRTGLKGHQVAPVGLRFMVNAASVGSERALVLTEQTDAAMIARLLDILVTIVLLLTLVAAAYGLAFHGI